MKTTLSLTLLFFGLSLSAAWAQNPNLDYKYALKIYNQSGYENYNYFEVTGPSAYYFDYSARRVQILHPTIAFQWNSGLSKSHEVELTGFSSGFSSKNTVIRSEEDDNEFRFNTGTVSSTNIALRYEYIRNFNKGKDTKLVPSFSGSLSPFFSLNKFNPYHLSDYPSSQMAVGLRAYVIPRLTYHFSSRFFIDFNIPICTHDISYVRDIVKHPVLSLSRQETSQFRFAQFPALYSGRLGIGFKM